MISAAAWVAPRSALIAADMRSVLRIESFAWPDKRRLTKFTGELEWERVFGHQSQLTTGAPFSIPSPLSAALGLSVHNE